MKRRRMFGSKWKLLATNPPEVVSSCLHAVELPLTLKILIILIPRRFSRFKKEKEKIEQCKERQTTLTRQADTHTSTISVLSVELIPRHSSLRQQHQSWWAWQVSSVQCQWPQPPPTPALHPLLSSTCDTGCCGAICPRNSVHPATL